MPGPVIPRPMADSSLPDWAKQLMTMIALSPASTGVQAASAAAEPMLESIGKPVSEMFGAKFSPEQTKTGVPQRLRFDGWNANKNQMQFAGSNAQMPRMDATPQQIDQLINGGALGLEQPPSTAVEAIRKKLAAILGGQ